MTNIKNTDYKGHNELVCTKYYQLFFVILGPEKRPHIPCKVVDEGSGKFRIEFTTVEVRDVDVIFTVFCILLKN